MHKVSALATYEFEVYLSVKLPMILMLNSLYLNSNQAKENRQVKHEYFVYKLLVIESRVIEDANFDVTNLLGVTSGNKHRNCK